MHLKGVDKVSIKKGLEDLLMPIWHISIIQAQPKRGTGRGKPLQFSAGTILASLSRSAPNIALNSVIKVKIKLCLIHKIPHKRSFPSVRHSTNKHARRS